MFYLKHWLNFLPGICDVFPTDKKNIRKPLNPKNVFCSSFFDSSSSITVCSSLMNTEFSPLSLHMKCSWSDGYTEAGVIVKIAFPDDRLCVWNVGGALQVGVYSCVSCVSVCSICMYLLPLLCVIHVFVCVSASTSDHMLSVCSSIHLLHC